MAENDIDDFAETYLNPVYSKSFPDPFVLKYRGEYFAYCTGFWHDGRVFGVLRSRDLVNWFEVGGAMLPLDTGAPFYWAPEITYSNGKFYLYYSVGNETLMEIRVAVSDRPDGGFIDSGKKLTTEDFAIDAHVFTDETGEKYLFYATDFLSHTHIGTGTVVDKMVDYFTLEGNPRPVTRAKYDWQVYDANRIEKGGVRWHTVEGAFVLKRKGVYYEMFSGGNWQNISYGVSFAATGDIEKNEEWQQFSDGENVLPVLRTLPGAVIGPGHNSVIRGANNRELFCVYHRWAQDERVLAIDRMDFAGNRIFIKGATNTPQIAPFPPAVADFFDEDQLNQNWLGGGEWEISDNQAVSGFSGRSELICRHKAESFLCEFSLRAAETNKENGVFGFYLRNEAGGKTLEFLIQPKENQAIVKWLESGEIQKRFFRLAADFAPFAFHLLRVEADGRFIRISLDEAALNFEKVLETSSNQIAFVADDMRAAFSGFALTEGFEDLFDRKESGFETSGWRNLSGTGELKVENGELFLSNKNEPETILSKGSAHKNFEFAANLRLIEAFGENFDFGFVVLNGESKVISRIKIEREAGAFYLSTGKDSPKFPLPKNFDIESCRQFRILKTGGKLFLQSEDAELGKIPAPGGETKIGLFCRRSAISVEMARLTVL